MPSSKDVLTLTHALSEEESPTPVAGTRIGWVSAMDEEGYPLVDFEGNTSGLLRARLVARLGQEELQAAIASRQAAVLLLEKEWLSSPILLGLIQVPSKTPLIDATLEQSLASVPREARVDGKQVIIEGREEVVLRCGKASITLTRDGQLLLYGVSIRSEAQEVQRIKGGKVQIN